MRIRSSAFIDPARNGPYAISAVALSVLVYAYSTWFGPASVLAYYGLWLPLVVLAPQTIFGHRRSLVLPGLFVALLLASTLWSDAPSTTLRGSVQFATHALCILVAARVVNFRSLTRGILLGTGLVVLYSLVFGYSAYDVMDGSYTFVGAFGSKNQLGLYCSVAILFAMFSLFTQRERLGIRAGVLLLALVCAAVLDASRSATSKIALGVAAIAFFGFVATLRLGPAVRGFVLLLLLPASAVVALAAQQLGAVAAVLRFFGKDPTLTGRTQLWDEGLRSFAETPIAGVGYMGYWVQGFADAERLWHEFYITARTGFHFHNTFIETLVELGVVGTVLMALLFLVPLARLMRRVLAGRDTMAACQLSLLAMMLVRSMSEVDVLYPYTLGSFLLFQMLAAPAGSVKRAGSTARRPSTWPGNPRLSAAFPGAAFDDRGAWQARAGLQ